jgi:hypothetical protein
MPASAFAPAHPTVRVLAPAGWWQELPDALRGRGDSVFRESVCEHTGRARPSGVRGLSAALVPAALVPVVAGPSVMCCTSWPCDFHPSVFRDFRLSAGARAEKRLRT